MSNPVTTRVNAGLYHVHVSNGAGGLRFYGKVERREDRSWFTAIPVRPGSQELDYDRDFDSKRAAIDWIKENVS